MPAVSGKYASYSTKRVAKLIFTVISRNLPDVSLPIIDTIVGKICVMRLKNKICVMRLKNTLRQ